MNKQKISHENFFLFCLSTPKLTYWFTYLSCSNVFTVNVICHNWAVKLALYAIIVTFNSSAKWFCSDSIDRKMNAPNSVTPKINKKNDRINFYESKSVEREQTDSKQPSCPNRAHRHTCGKHFARNNRMKNKKIISFVRSLLCVIPFHFNWRWR